MRSKNILVSFLAIASVLLLAVTVAATHENASVEDYTIDSVKINGISAVEAVSVIAGETATFKIQFTANADDSDVRVEVEVEGEKDDVTVKTEKFDVEKDTTYRKTLTVTIPYDLQDDLSEDVAFTVTIDGAETNVENTTFTALNVQRPSYTAEVKSLSMPNTVDAGETFAVDVVMSNVGYNDLDDLFVTVSIPALNIADKEFLGDIVAIECSDDSQSDCDDEDAQDTVRGKLYLKVPSNAEAGVYAVEVESSNDDSSDSVVAQIVVNNDFANNVIATSSKKTAAVGDDAAYDLLVVNPTSKLKVYKIVAESSDAVSSTTDDSVIAVPAGSSKTVTVNAVANVEGEHDFTVSVISGSELVSSTSLSLVADGESVDATSSVAVLTVVLAIVFLVLLVVLIVLIGKKPNKSEEFGESYY